MATISGTIHSDTLFGTSGDDYFRSFGITGYDQPDFLSGGDGNDIYDLRDSRATSPPITTSSMTMVGMAGLTASLMPERWWPPHPSVI